MLMMIKTDKIELFGFYNVLFKNNNNADQSQYTHN
jgi:hypothetical protein